MHAGIHLFSPERHKYEKLHFNQIVLQQHAQEPWHQGCGTNRHFYVASVSQMRIIHPQFLLFHENRQCYTPIQMHSKVKRVGIIAWTCIEVIKMNEVCSDKWAGSPGRIVFALLPDISHKVCLMYV